MGYCLRKWTQIACNALQWWKISEKNNLIGALFQDKDEYFATPKGKKIVEQNAAEDKKLKDAKFRKLEKKAKKIGARVVMIENEREEEEETMMLKSLEKNEAKELVMLEEETEEREENEKQEGEINKKDDQREEREVDQEEERENQDWGKVKDEEQEENKGEGKLKKNWRRKKIIDNFNLHDV